MKTKRPLITVITVCFNAEEYIEQCIRSVLDQAFDDFEYIVIDGGSKDGTTSIIRKYAEGLAYYHSKPDRGIAHGFNLGIERAKGQWIAFLNADDLYIDNQVLEVVAQTLIREPTADLVYGRIQVVQRKEQINPISKEIGGEWVWSEFRRCSIIPHPASFTNLSYFNSFGGFDETFRNALDYEYYLRAGSELKVVVIPKLLTWMRDGGMSKDDAIKSYSESRRAQVKNKSLSVAISWVVFWGYFIRVKVKKLLRANK